MKVDTSDSVYLGEIESEKYQSKIYDDIFYKKILAYEGYKSELITFMQKNNVGVNAKLLDVGCGTGWFLTLLSKNGYSNLTGLDISPDMLKVAKQKLPNIDFIEKPIQEVNSNIEYDAITCVGALHHMPDLERVCEKLFLLLRPGGMLIIHEPNEDWWYENSIIMRVIVKLLYAQIRIKNWKKNKNLRAPWANIPQSPHHQDIAIDELINTLAKCGFSLVNIEYKNAFMRVFEGMLFKNSSIDRLLYKFIKKQMLLSVIVTLKIEPEQLLCVW
ncbi:MAG: class I SAM-dependent methyltransferase [Enterobacteriaceae bacterium]